jgi:hypothetical protein
MLRRLPRIDVRRRLTGEAPLRMQDGQGGELGSFSLLHRAPVVLFAPEWEILNPASAVWSVLNGIPTQTTYLVVGPSWDVDERRGELLTTRVAQLAERFPQLVVVASCATLGEVAILQRQGLTALHCAVSALVRDDFFTPGPVRPRSYDAIYDARWSDYKRHDLAGAVRSLALIAPSSMCQAPCSVGYAVRARVAVRHATWLSSPWGLTRPKWLSHDQVNAAYNQARVGLCLSRVEGVMFASIQYLLAGLPVVTTRNLGGRDEFFSASHVRWVDDDPEAVASAVDGLAALNLDPQVIRDDTLARMGEHRGRMQAWIQSVILADGGELGRWGGGWPTGLPNKLREPKRRGDDIVAEINGTERR